MKQLDVTVRIKNNLLLERRRALGLNQIDAAKYIGVRHDHYAALESLRKSPLQSSGEDEEWTDDALAIADFFDVQPEELWPEAILSVAVPVINRKIDAADVALLSAPSASLMLPPPDNEIERADLERSVEAALETLTPREASVIRARFGLGGKDPMTLEQIGDETATTCVGSDGRRTGQDNRVGISRNRVRQIELHALRKLRHPSRSKRLVRFVEP